MWCSALNPTRAQIRPQIESIQRYLLHRSIAECTPPRRSMKNSMSIIIYRAVERVRARAIFATTADLFLFYFCCFLVLATKQSKTTHTTTTTTTQLLALDGYATLTITPFRRRSYFPLTKTTNPLELTPFRWGIAAGSCATFPVPGDINASAVLNSAHDANSSNPLADLTN